MGKFMRKSRRGEIAVLEGCLGVRTRARSLVADFSCLRKMEARIKDPVEDGHGGRAPAQLDEDAQISRSESWDQGAEASSAQNLVVPDREEHHDDDFPRPTEEDHLRDPEQAFLSRCAPNSASSPHLRESHSDSCLRSRIPIDTAHSRSNSASFSYDLAGAVPDHRDDHSAAAEESDLALDPCSISSVAAEFSSVEVSVTTREVEASCCGDNALVLCAAKEKSQTSSVSCQDGVSLSLSAAPTSNELKRSSSASRLGLRPRTATDCGPAWRHRVAASAPTPDEIEEFFAAVEKEDDSSKRFVDKYNFDVFNDVPLSGRFEWVQFPSRSA